MKLVFGLRQVFSKIRRYFSKPEENRKTIKAKKKAMREIDDLRVRLFDLGLTEKAMKDLNIILNDKKNQFRISAAAWVLSTWYANQNDEKSAKKCLDLLPLVLKKNSDSVITCRANVLKAECLERLGKTNAAREVIKSALERYQDANLYLAASNLESDLDKKINFINQALSLHDIPMVSVKNLYGAFPYDCLQVNNLMGFSDENIAEWPLVTVIMPVYNGGRVIKTALNSLLNQTWPKLEIIVVDDCSNDETAKIVKSYMEIDCRVTLVTAPKNGGPYVARNLALKEARGEFVTCHDADDWSHPKKIEKQALHLHSHPNVVGNMSQQARADDYLKYSRRGNPGYYIFPNTSSLMFRRSKVVSKLGCWDNVRFGGDSEFIWRINKVFGADSVITLQYGPLSFQRLTESSLTAHHAFGYHGSFYGARKEYADSFKFFAKKTASLKYHFTQKQRPYPVPEPMWSERERTNSGRRHFDVVFVSDYRYKDESDISKLIAGEIIKQNKMGLRTGLIQMHKYCFDPRAKINLLIREILNGTDMQMIVYGEKISCSLLVVREPAILQEYQSFIPDVKAKTSWIVINSIPEYGKFSDSTPYYSFKQCTYNFVDYFKSQPVWMPFDRSVRNKLLENCLDDLDIINLAGEDWSTHCIFLI